MLKISRESEINLINVLIDHDIISGKDLPKIKKVSAEGNTSQIDAVFELKLTDEKKILDVLVKEQNLEVIDLTKVQITEDYVASVVNGMVNSGELEKGKGVTEGFLSGKIFEMRPELKKKEYRAEGGPVQAGQPYVVGEKGPEVVIPKADANVVSNDDSQVMGMLLASNPQLQNVSKARAESILRSRFPDYFA